MYQPDETIRLEVRMGDDIIWLTQQQIALLFGVKQPAISKHLINIFKSGELHEASVHSILEYTATDGKVYKTKFYNLDAILSVGYRVNSINATKFRQWANQVLKDYLLKGYSINQRIERLEQRVSRTEDKIDFFVRTSLPACSGHTHQRLCLGARHSVANQDFVALRNSLFYLPLYIGHCATHHCQHAHISPKTLHRFR